MQINANVIGKISSKTTIYRIFPRNRFLQLFNENQNALILPTKWDDPFENVFLQADVVSASGEKGHFGFQALILCAFQWLLGPHFDSLSGAHFDRLFPGCFF